MSHHTVNDDQTLSRRVYCGASVMRVDDRGRPSILIRNFSKTQDAAKFVDEIYAAGSKAEFKVYESWSYPLD